MSLEDRLYPLLATYERLPNSARRLLGNCYSLLPESLRLGENFETFRALAEQTPSLSGEAARAFQEEQIHRQLEVAWNHCPGYRAAMEKAGVRPGDFREIEDLQKFPILTRGDLLNGADSYRNQSLPLQQALYLTTGGSTGEPIGIYLQRGVSRPKEQAFLSAVWSQAGYYEGARVVELRGHVTSSSPEGPIFRYEPARGWLILSVYHLTSQRLPEYLEILRDFQPEYILAYPSAALELRALMEQNREVPGIALDGVLCGSERLTLSQRRLLEESYSCPVVHWYGHSERVLLASAEPGEPDLAFWSTYGRVEFGAPTEDGLREIIGTSFHNTMMPLIRYRTGDFAQGIVEQRSGQSSAADIAGRTQEFLITADGRRIPLAALNMHTDVSDGLSALQFFQDRPGTAELRYVPMRAFDTSHVTRLVESMKRKLGDDFRLTARQVDTTEKTARGKHRWLVSTLVNSI